MTEHNLLDKTLANTLYILPIIYRILLEDTFYEGVF